MEKDEYPRLCGGTFFVLVLQALKQRIKAKEHWHGDSDGLSDPEVLIGLVKVVNPDYVAPVNPKDTLKTITNNFKSCQMSRPSEYLPFGKIQEMNAFDERVKQNYSRALQDMNTFVQDYLEVQTSVHKDVNLVKALMDLVNQDESILPGDLFYVQEDGAPMTKTELCKMSDVCFQAFLLGIWHYVVLNRPSDKVGEKTYNEWCPSAGGSKREYSGNMGEAIKRDIDVFLIDDIQDTALDDSEAEVIDCGDEDDGTDNGPEETASENEDQVPPPLNPQQLSQFAFNFTQNGNSNTQIGYINQQVNKK